MGRVESVEFCSAEQGLDDSGPFSGAFGTGEQPVFFAQRDGSDGVFDRIVVDGQMAGFGIADQALPTFQGIVDGFGGAAAIGGLGSGLQ